MIKLPKLKLSNKPPDESPIGTYRIDVVSLPEECDWEKYLPVEIRYIFNTAPECKEKIRKILAEGKAIGVRTVLKTPENILKAVHTISVHSQKNYIVTWLPKLLRDKHLPIITEADRAAANAHGENLDEAVQTILRDRVRFKRLVLIDEENIGIRPEEQRLMTELSEYIYPLAVDYSVFRVIADNARERTHVAQAIIKMLLIVGPLAHFLEKFVSGIAAKLFAASADDILGETAELTALRGSGFTWRELAKRSRILIPVFILATWGAVSVEGLLEHGSILLAGCIFGLSAVALSLTTAIQSLFMYRRNIVSLSAESKVGIAPTEFTRLAFVQDFTNPARLGLILGASLAPVMGMLAAVTGLMNNGFVLAAIGSTESIVAGITVLLADRINEWRFHRRLLRRFKKAS